MVLLAMVMQLGTSPGQTFAVSAFTPSLLESLELSQSQLGLAYMLGTLLAAIPLSMVGPASDRFGLRFVSCIVIVGLSTACFCAAGASGYWTLLFSFFLLRFLGQGALTLLAGNTTAMWFRSRIGRVSAILSIGSAVAFAYIPHWITESISAYGWRGTYQIISAILLVGLLPLVCLLYRNRPEDLGQHVDGLAVQPSSERSHTNGTPKSFGGDSLTLRQAMRTASYSILAGSNIVWAMSGTGILFYLFTLCDERSLGAAATSGLFRYLGFSMLAAQLAGGVLADYLRLNRLFGLGTSLVAASLVVLATDHTERGAECFAVLFGAGQGMLISISGIAMLRFYGRDHLGSVRGAVWCGTVAGSGCGPLLMGWIHDTSGSYDPAIGLFAALMLPLAIASWFIRPPILSRPR